MLVYRNRYGWVVVEYDPDTFNYIPADIERAIGSGSDTTGVKHFALVKVKSMKGKVLFWRSIQKGNTSKIVFRFPWHFEINYRTAQERLEDRIKEAILFLERFQNQEEQEELLFQNSVERSLHFSDSLNELHTMD